MGKKRWTVYTPLGDWRGIWAYDETEAKEIVLVARQSAR